MNIRLRRAVRTVLATAALALASGAHAETFRWNVTFDFVWGGGQGKGVFYSDGQTFTNWDITTFRDESKPIYEEVVFGYHYTSETSTLDTSDGFRLLRNDGPQDPGVGAGNYLYLGLQDAMSAGGTFTSSALERSLSWGGSSLSQSGIATMTSSLDNSLQPVSPPVPEPETIGMLLLGLGFVGAAVKRKQRNS